MTNLLQHATRAIDWSAPYADDPFAIGGGYIAAPSSGIPSQETIATDFLGLTSGAFTRNAVVFACEAKRVGVFSEALFLYQMWNKGQPGRLWSDESLDILETPWPLGTTGDLLARSILHADLGGNAYVARQFEQPDRLRILRPDHVILVMGDRSGQPVKSAAQLDADLIGLIYDPRDGQTQPEALTRDEFAHFAPMPDPLARFRGMSWLTPVVREILGDQAMTEHKLGFLAHAATPQLVVTFDASVGAEAFEKFVAKMDKAHAGWQNAYKTLYLGGGADVTVAGRDLQQLDFSKVQGRGETRIAAASGIHPTLVPLSEGMEGSSLNAGNYAAARRSTADTTFRHLWRNICGSLQAIVPPPRGSRLWINEAAIAFLREDSTDRAQVSLVQAQTIGQLVKDGFTPQSAVDAVMAEDMSMLVHTGMTSVQLIPPGGPEGIPADQQQARNLVEMVQKVYLGVGVVLSAEEARGMLNKAGADLSPGGLRALANGNGKPAAIVPAGAG